MDAFGIFFYVILPTILLVVQVILGIIATARGQALLPFFVIAFFYFLAFAIEWMWFALFGFVNAGAVRVFAYLSAIRILGNMAFGDEPSDATTTAESKTN